MIVFVDMDMTLVNFYNHFMKYAKLYIRHRQDFDIHKEITNIHDLKTCSCTSWVESLGIERNMAWDIRCEVFNSLIFWTSMSFLNENTYEIFMDLCNRHDVYISTSAFDSNSFSCIEGKVKWVDKYLPFFDRTRLIYCHHKELLKGDIIIDDYVSVLEKFNGTTIAMDYPYNNKVKTDYKVRNWSDIKRLLEL